MPDRRTVYMTDDGTNTALWKFIADRKNDMSSGATSVQFPAASNKELNPMGPCADASQYLAA
jgi:hypothetical protein